MDHNDNRKPGDLIREGTDGRVGETRWMTKGKATIIAYRGAKDIDIEFEDGTPRNGVKYYHFTKGKVAPYALDDKVNYIGQRNQMKNGDWATIIEYNGTMNIRIQFDDTTEVDTQYGAFKRGLVQKNKKTHHDKSRIGKQMKAKNGQMMTIIAYRTSNDIDVQFDDGTIVEHVTYGRFKSGSIKNPSAPIKPTAKLERIGEKNQNNDGKWMKIIKYRSCVDMDVEFEDGKIRQHVSYLCFQKGGIKHPDDSRRIVKQKSDTNLGTDVDKGSQEVKDV